jgi:hypothetical protein
MVTIDTVPSSRPMASDAAQDTQPRVARRRRLWPLALAAVVALVGLSFVSPAGRHQWALSFIRQPSRFTALSFQNAAALPRNIEAGARIHLAFTVANHEGRQTKYPYVLSSANPNGTSARTVLDRAALTVPSGTQRTASVTVRPVCAASACEVQVSLLGHPETLDVLLDVHRHRG